MSSYLTTSDSDEENPVSTSTPEEIEQITAVNKVLKSEGDIAFTSRDYEISIKKYSEAIENLKQAKLAPNMIFHLNRWLYFCIVL